jgi:hypothetical protein
MRQIAIMRQTALTGSAPGEPGGCQRSRPAIHEDGRVVDPAPAPAAPAAGAGDAPVPVEAEPVGSGPVESGRLAFERRDWANALGRDRTDLYTAGIIWFAFTGKNAFDLTELAADFLHHSAGCASHSAHRQRREIKRGRDTAEDANQNCWIKQIHIIESHKVLNRQVGHTNGFTVYDQFCNTA